MCNFLSAIVLESGEILCDPEHTDNHEDLIAANNIRDGQAQRGRFARVEFVPPQSLAQIPDLTKWQLRIDEAEAPDWLDQTALRDRMEGMVRRMMVVDARAILLGGCYLLFGQADVAKVLGSRIFAMWDSARVGEMGGSARVGKMWDSARVGEMGDSARVGEMGDSARVGAMWGSAQVGAMWDSARVGKMGGSARVGEMWGSAQVGEMGGSAQVGKMWGSAQVGIDLRTPKEKEGGAM